MKKKLLLIYPPQFGYHIDGYYYCKYLRDEFDITYICWDHDLSKIEMSDIEVVYINRSGNFFFRAIRFLKCTLKKINNNHQIIVIKYFKGISLLLKLLKPKCCFVLDIRTGSIEPQPFLRKFQDIRLRVESTLFKNITIISQSLAEKFNISHKTHILPLGSDIISSKNKSFNSLRLLYVGTLYNRNLETTLEGFKRFYDKFKHEYDISYTILGKGKYGEEDFLRRVVDDCQLNEVVTVEGFIPHNKLSLYFESANIGVSYIPLTDYFDVQPPTKTFEYLLSGMPVIATRTKENAKVINNLNGVMIGDSVEEFYKGIKLIASKKDFFDSQRIRNQSLQYTWKNIVQNNLKLYLNKIYNTDIK